MLIKKILLSSLVLGCTGMISCTDLDGSSSLGQDIVNSVNPNRTNFDNNFLFSDTAMAIAAKSINTQNDTLSGFQTGVITVGQKSDREARGSVLFSFDGTFKKAHVKDSLISVNLQFQSLKLLTDTSVKTYPESLQIYNGSTIPLTSQESLESAKTVAQSDSSYDSASKKIVFKGSVDDVAMMSSFKALFNTTDSSVCNFRFLIANNDSFFNLYPVAKITFKYKRDTTVINDTVSSKYSYNVKFEKSALKALRDSVPMTSSETGRKVVFTLDMKQFWKSMDKKAGFTQFLSAKLSISNSLIPGGDTSDVISFRYYISPDSLCDVNAIRDSTNHSGKPAATNRSDTISLHAEAFLQRAISKRPPKMYLYISSDKSNAIQQEILWIKPTITAVFTNTL
jgi:hypothetical protein